MKTTAAAFILFAVFAVTTLGSDCQLERCTREIVPVCGFNEQCKKMFHNECTMRNYNCESQEEFKKVPLEVCDGCCL